MISAWNAFSRIKELSSKALRLSVANSSSIVSCLIIFGLIIYFGLKHFQLFGPYNENFYTMMSNCVNGECKKTKGYQLHVKIVDEKVYWAAKEKPLRELKDCHFIDNDNWSCMYGGIRFGVSDGAQIADSPQFIKNGFYTKEKISFWTYVNKTQYNSLRDLN